MRIRRVLIYEGSPEWVKETLSHSAVGSKMDGLNFNQGDFTKLPISGHNTIKEVELVEETDATA